MPQENQRASELNHSEKVGGMAFPAAEEQATHIYVVRQLVIIESFWWLATYNPCRNRVLSANGLPQKDVRLLRAIE